MWKSRWTESLESQMGEGYCLSHYAKPRVDHSGYTACLVCSFIKKQNLDKSKYFQLSAIIPTYWCCSEESSQYSVTLHVKHTAAGMMTNSSMLEMLAVSSVEMQHTSSLNIHWSQIWLKNDVFGTFLWLSRTKWTHTHSQGTLFASSLPHQGCTSMLQLTSPSGPYVLKHWHIYNFCKQRLCSF